MRKNKRARIGNVVVDAFELVGLLGVDFMLNGDDVWTLEVNPRYTASVEIVERFSGVSAIAEHAAAFGAGPTPLGNEYAPARSAFGKGILYARRDGVISESFAQWSLDESARVPWPTIADVSPAGTPIEIGRPILTLFAEAEDVAGVEQQLRAKVSELEAKVYE